MGSTVLLCIVSKEKERIALDNKSSLMSLADIMSIATDTAEMGLEEIPENEIRESKATGIDNKPMTKAVEEKVNKARLIEIVKERYAPTTDNSFFGIYVGREVDANGQGYLETNKQGLIVIKGNTRKLAKNFTYEIEIGEKIVDPKWGVQYTINNVLEERLTTVDSQDRFVKQMVTERQFQILKKAYPSTKLMDAILNDQIDISLLSGIKEATLESIKKNILDNKDASLLISKLSEYNLKSSMISKIQNHFGGDSQQAYEIISEYPYRLTEIKGIGFLSIDKYVKNIVGVQSEQRIDSATLYSIKDAIEYGGHIYLPADDLIQKVSNLIPEVDRVTIRKRLYENKSIVVSNIDNEEVVGVINMWYTEEQIYLELKRISENFVPNHSIAEIKEGIKRLEELQGFEFTDEQKEATISTLTNGTNVLTGGGGVGKSATVVAMCRAIEGFQYATCAISGKASNVLRQRELYSSTLHRLLGYVGGSSFASNRDNPINFSFVVFDEISMASLPIILDFLKAIPNGTGILFVGDPNQLPAIGYGDMLRDLIDISNKAPDFFVKIHRLTKNHRQAERSGTIQVANAVAKMEFYVDESQPYHLYGEDKDLFVGYSNSREGVENLAIQIATKFKEEQIKAVDDVYSIQFIAPTKGRGEFNPETEYNTTRSLNLRLQEIFNPLDVTKSNTFGEVKEEDIFKGLESNGFFYRNNDKVMSQGNSYGILMFKELENAMKFADKEFLYEVEGLGKVNKADLVLEIGEKEANKAICKLLEAKLGDVYNGTFGLVRDSSKDYLIVEFENTEGYVVLTKSEVNKMLQLAYATSIHKMQGSSAKYVVSVFDTSAYIMLSKQLVYTALTRTEVKHYMLAMPVAMNRALAIDASTSRRTRLAKIATGELKILYGTPVKSKRLDLNCKNNIAKKSHGDNDARDKIFDEDSLNVEDYLPF